MFRLSLVGSYGCKRAVVEASMPRAAEQPGPVAPRQIRATGSIQAVRAVTVQVPQLRGQNVRITLVRLVTNGTRVKPGELLAEFDRTQQMDAAREAQGEV